MTVTEREGLQGELQRRLERELEGEVTEERLTQIRHAAETLLSNPVIEDYTVHVEQE